jgi:hypothetical protein
MSGFSSELTQPGPATTQPSPEPACSISKPAQPGLGLTQRDGELTRVRMLQGYRVVWQRDADLYLVKLVQALRC